MEKELPKRKSTRLENYNYNTCGAYFLTICTEHRKQILSRVIVGGDVLDAPPNDAFDTSNMVELLPCGEIADKYINQLNHFYNDIKIVRYVIMPNHIHLMLLVFSNDGASRTSPPTKQHSIVSRFVSTFKRFCNKEYGNNIWQRNFYDHIIRNEKDYDDHVKYICENPIHWHLDKLYAEE